jgi:hypothetical protein
MRAFRAMWVVGVAVAGCGGGPDADDGVPPTDSHAETAGAESGSDTPDDTPAAADADADGAPSDVDCDDDDAFSFPGAPERCDGRDNDCDRAVPDAEALVDGDPACKPCSDAGYYEAMRDAVDGADLWSRLAEAVATNGSCDYSDTTDWMFLILDKDAAGEVRCVYTGQKIAVGSTKPAGDVMNTEHTWPQSLGAEIGQRRCDLHHLFPTMADANTRRGSDPLRPVASGVDWQEGGSQHGRDALGNPVFEPRDDHKGDVARALIYMQLRYAMDVVAEDEALYVGWHAFDPPTDADVARSLKIKTRQGNANPFVVCPEAMSRVVMP